MTESINIKCIAADVQPIALQGFARSASHTVTLGPSEPRASTPLHQGSSACPVCIRKAFHRVVENNGDSYFKCLDRVLFARGSEVLSHPASFSDPPLQFRPYPSGGRFDPQLLIRLY